MRPNTEECQRRRGRKGSSKLESQPSSLFSLSPVPHCTNPSAILWICGWTLQHEPVIIYWCPPTSMKLFYGNTQRSEARKGRKQKFLQPFPFRWNSDHLDTNYNCFSSDCNISSILRKWVWGQSWDSGYVLHREHKYLLLYIPTSHTKNLNLFIADKILLRVHIKF